MELALYHSEESILCILQNGFQMQLEGALVM